MKPKVGDFATHVSGGLDPRRVTRVSEDGQEVWLFLLTEEHGPFPAKNYKYDTPKEEA